MTAKTLSRLRAFIMFGGILFGIAAAIGVAAWESQRGRPLDIPMLRGGERDGVRSDPIPTPAVVGIVPSVVCIAVSLTMAWIPAVCPHCGARAVFPVQETKYMKLYRCGQCNKVDEDAPAEKRRKRTPSGSDPH